MLFKELKVGEKFIVKPLPEDRGAAAFVVFIKSGIGIAVSLVNGTSSLFPFNMDVVKIRGGD